MDCYSPFVKFQFVDSYDNTHKGRVQWAVGLEIVRLRVTLKLRGTDIGEKPFEEVSATENVSQTGFLCGCTAVLKIDSTIEVHLVSGGTKSVGKLRVVRSEARDTPYPRYAFRFVQKDGAWILQ